MHLNEIFNNTKYGYSVFTNEEIAVIEKRINKRSENVKQSAYIICLVREKELRLTPEEIVRQLYLYRLMNEYGYPANRLRVEFPVNFGREVKRADIVVMDKLNPTAAYIIIEVKKPKLKDGKEQLKSYTNATGAPIAVWTNGEQVSCYNRKDPNYFEQLTDIPKASEKLSDILNERITYAELKERDKIAKERRSLRDLIIEIEDEVLANAGVDSFEEVFKLIFSKLYDELAAANDARYYLQFRRSGDTDSELKVKIDDLFKAAKKKWNGIFTDSDTILLTPSHLAVCVSTLQDIKLFNNNLDVVDDAFEYLMSKSQKGEKGQYFTPRYVIDMCVKMMNPGENENIIDTAAGSSGFPVHAIFHVWKKIRKELKLPSGESFTTDKRTERETAFVRDHIFAIDFDEKAVRVARTLNLIAGDGQSNVIHLNTLDYGRWDEVVTQRPWSRNYNDGFNRLLDIRPKDVEEKDYSQFAFDLLMANPPFAGDIKEGTILAKYDLGENEKGKQQSKVGRDILFIERNLDFLKAGGRMAIVLPQGRFNNSSDKRIRDFIAERCRILAVVGLHGNVFKPHTGTKTSVLFVQKWDDKKCPKKNDYPIFFATMQKPSKDNSGDKIYVLDAETHEPKLDTHGHLIVDHDLYNHDGLTSDGIAEAFIEFAKRENLSFFDKARPFDAKKYSALMSGLEAVEIKYNETIKNKDFRIDSQFYTIRPKRNLTLTYEKIGKCLQNSQYGISITMNEESKGYPIYRMNEIHNMLCDLDVDKYAMISASEFETFKLHNGDILFNRTNSYEFVGRTGIYYRNAGRTPMVFASYLVRFTPDEKKINAEYLTAFLNCKYGVSEIRRRARQSINQTNVNPEEVKEIMLPLLCGTIQNSIQRLFQRAHKLRVEATTFYTIAESRLLSTLDMENFTPSSEPVAVKTLAESFGESGRLDAEYYQQKYDDIENKMSAEKAIRCNIHDGVFIPRKGEYKYIELSDIGASGNITGCTSAPFDELPTRARRLVKRGQVIVSSIEGSLASCAIIPDEYDGAICSTGFYIVDSPVINAETLLVLFKSAPIQALMKKRCSGTILTALSKTELESIPLPLIDVKIQQKITASVQYSFALRRESERLLDAAKRAVEMAIESGEEFALEWLAREGG